MHRSKILQKCQKTEVKNFARVNAHSISANQILLLGGMKYSDILCMTFTYLSSIIIILKMSYFYEKINKTDYITYFTHR